VLNIEKTIAGAQKYCKYHIPPKHLVIGVGSNDLDKKKQQTYISDKGKKEFDVGTCGTTVVSLDVLSSSFSFILKRCKLFF
jgi:hypothetical protein